MILEVYVKVTSVLKGVWEITSVFKKYPQKYLACWRETIADSCISNMFFSHAFLKSATFGTLYSHEKEDFCVCYKHGEKKVGEIFLNFWAKLGYMDKLEII